MSISALLNTLAAKTEVIYKNDPVPTFSANAILLRNGATLSPVENDTDERDNAKGYFGHNQTLVAATKRKLSYEVELAGGGTPLATVPAWAPLLRACAFGQTVVAVTSVSFAPVTAQASIESLTQYFNIGDKKYIMVGSRGNVKTKWTAGKIPLAMFEFTGLLPATNHVVDDTTYGGTQTLTAWKQPQIVNFANTPTFSVHGFGTSEMYSMEIDMGNQVVYRNKPNAEDVIIIGRKPTVTLSIGEPTLAQKNYFTNQIGAILDVLSLTHGVGAGNVLSVSSPKMQIESIELGKEDEVRVLNIKGRLMPNAGNDEFVLTAT